MTIRKKDTSVGPYDHADKEKCKAYTSMRFDALSNLWLMDNEGRVTCWATPFNNSESKKPKEVVWQESEHAMIPCMPRVM